MGSSGRMFSQGVDKVFGPKTREIDGNDANNFDKEQEIKTANVCLELSEPSAVQANTNLAVERP